MRKSLLLLLLAHELIYLVFFFKHSTYERNLADSETLSQRVTQRQCIKI